VKVYIIPFVVGALFLLVAFFYFRTTKFKISILFGVLGLLFLLAPFPWWVFFAFFGVVALWYIGLTMRFARKRNAVINQTGDKWYRFASSEIYSERGQRFLQTHFAEAFHPDRARTEIDRLLAQTAALGAYLRLLEENGKDATQYDTLPVNGEAISLARVLSRAAIPSLIYKDVH
jgi:hypothetical protein